jgi:RNA polymerase sigma-70 factor, ECF subfamily
MRTTNDEAPDNDYVFRAQAGDSISFEVLFDRYYDMIHAFTYRICLVESEAEDLTQETFIRAARGIGGYRGTASFKNWLFRIAHHAVVDWQRQQARRRENESAFSAEMELRSEARKPDHTAVHAALSQLPVDWREAVALVYFDDMSHGEAAKIMGCAETTVSWRIFRARRALRPVLEAKKGAL